MGITEWYLIGMNLLVFVLMGLDKEKAIRGQWRIPERVFFVLSLFGGSGGCVGGMFTFRHKTKKPVFRIGVPLLCLFQIGLYMLWKGYI